MLAVPSVVSRPNEYFVHRLPFNSAFVSTRICFPTRTARPVRWELSHIVIESLALIPGLVSARKAPQSPRSMALVTNSYEPRRSEVELLDATLRLDAHDPASIPAKSQGIMSIKRFIRGD